MIVFNARFFLPGSGRFCPRSLSLLQESIRSFLFFVFSTPARPGVANPRQLSWLSILRYFVFSVKFYLAGVLSVYSNLACSRWVFF